MGSKPFSTPEQIKHYQKRPKNNNHHFLNIKKRVIAKSVVLLIQILYSKQDLISIPLNKLA